MFKQFPGENSSFPYRPTRLNLSDRGSELHDRVQEKINAGQEPRLVKIPVGKIRATQAGVRKHRDRKEEGWSENDPPFGHADHPVGLRDKEENVHLVDGHHRADAAVGRGMISINVYVYDE